MKTKFLATYIVFFTCFFGFSQEKVSFSSGVMAAVGVNTSASKSALTYGISAFFKKNTSYNFFHVARLSYHLKQEKFEYNQYVLNGSNQLIANPINVRKNYGVLVLDYTFNYYFLKKELLKSFVFGGVGFNDLFWLKTTLFSPLLEKEQTLAQTQFLYTNPLTRPSLVLGVGALLPYELKSKEVFITAEVDYDTRFKNAVSTYPNFLSYLIRIGISF